MPEGEIVCEKENGIVTVTFNRPEVHNALNNDMVEGLGKALDDVENDPSSRALILTGAGEKYFSAGFDVKDAANSPKISPKARALWRRIDRFEKPVIAAINGIAMGGGLELALSCHFRIMADIHKPVLGLTELNLGIIPGWGGTQRLTQVIGKAKALDMILFGKTVNAHEALSMGLVNQVCPPDQLIPHALMFAEKLAKRPPIAVSCVLRAISAGIYEGFEQGLKVEEEGSAIVRGSEDRKEGFAAFLEKREPVFRGR